MDTQTEGSVTPEDLYDFVASLGTDRKLKFQETSALLLPLSTVMGLLDLTYTGMFNALRSKNSRLPTSKTIRKALSKDPEPLGRNAFMRLVRELPKLDGIKFRLVEGFKYGYVWKPGLDWSGIFESSFFVHDEAKAYWLQFVADAAELNVEMLRLSEAGSQEMFKRYANEPLVTCFGCAEMRPVLAQWLEENVGPETDWNGRRLGQILFMDCLAVLMRIMAWHVADVLVSQWGNWMVEIEEDVLPLESVMLYRGNSNPLRAGFERLARHAGWSGAGRPNAITYLGNIWTKHDEKTHAHETDPSIRRKQLEDWAQLRKGRPRFLSLLQLSEAVTSAQSNFADVDPQVLENYTWYQAAILRVAETLSRLQRDLLNVGFTNEQIAGLEDTYKSEYWLARSMLGKPHSQAVAGTAG